MYEEFRINLLHKYLRKMRKIIWTIMALCTLSGCKCENSTISADSLLDFVDPLIGTGGHGHTFPGAAYPFGMVQLSPDTGLEGWDWCSGYHYSDSSIIGFSHTHLSPFGIFRRKHLIGCFSNECSNICIFIHCSYWWVALW